MFAFLQHATIVSLNYAAIKLNLYRSIHPNWQIYNCPKLLSNLACIPRKPRMHNLIGDAVKILQLVDHTSWLSLLLNLQIIQILLSKSRCCSARGVRCPEMSYCLSLKKPTSPGLRRCERTTICLLVWHLWSSMTWPWHATTNMSHRQSWTSLSHPLLVRLTTPVTLVRAESTMLPLDAHKYTWLRNSYEVVLTI